MIDALLRHKDVKLVHESCRGVTGVEGDDTLGEYVAHLLAQLASAHAEGTKATFQASCAAGPPFRCRFDVAIEAEDPWRYGVHFDLLATGEIPESSIECPGAA